LSENYQVLALKWRPKQFKDVVGQDHITTTLQKAFEKNRIAQAFLFAGKQTVYSPQLLRWMKALLLLMQ
jgi:DNA polymerase-3 subunit gamma/tau